MKTTSKQVCNKSSISQTDAIFSLVNFFLWIDLLSKNPDPDDNRICALKFYSFDSTKNNFDLAEIIYFQRGCQKKRVAGV